MIAIIPARTGSVGLPGKNIKDLAGIPLIAHTIIAALESKCFHEVIVTTDGDDIEAISAPYGARVIKRPSSLGQDDTSMNEVIHHIHAIQRDSPESLFCLLQPTSPLRRSSHIVDCMEQFNKSQSKSAVSVCENSESPFKFLRLKGNHLEALFDQSFLSANRQTLEKTYRQNGAIYITHWGDFLATNHIIQFPAMPYFMTEEESIDIDSLKDFQFAEEVLISRGGF